MIGMIYERAGKRRGAMAGHNREVQTELAEWEEVAPRRWVRRLREWDGQ